jgi:AcrR family transcriptional regulator
MPKIVDKHERRLQFIQAAAEVFARKGFSATRMEDVARQARVSKGLLYEYYRSKEDMFLEVCERVVAWGPLTHVDAVPTVQTLAALVNQVASNYDAAQNFFLILTDYWATVLRGSRQQRQRFLAHVESFYATPRKAFAQFLRARQARGDLAPEVDCDVMANLLVACVEGIHMQDFLSPTSAHKREVLMLVSELVLHSSASPRKRSGGGARVSKRTKPPLDREA